MPSMMHSLLKYTATVVLLACAAAKHGGGEESEENENEGGSNTTLPAPLVATPSQHWEGVDGTWSTFELRVGTPPQTVRVLPATSWQEIWVVYGAAAGVCNTSLGVPSDCSDSRGVFFDSSKSSTWENNTQNFLGLREEMGFSGVGQYGFDSVGLGYDASGGPIFGHQIVSEIVSDTWWFGMLGLGFQPTNFSTYGNPQASFSATLSSHNTISSRSWAYTAGAYYQLKGVLGSLIFGGYDASKFTPNGVIFNMTSDNLRDIVVSIQSMTSTTASGSTTLMSTPEFAFIDSTVPELWLPTVVCEQFEKAFGLELDPTSELYLVNASTHANLQKLNPNITITLANQKSGGPTANITLPYAAFDLNISAPLLPNATSVYFPIRRTDNASMYTLGRTFLQEAYVVAHYDSRTFNVSQAIFSDSSSSEILALPPDIWASPARTTSGEGKGEHNNLSSGAIAGIVIGSLLGATCVGLLIAFLIMRRRRAVHKSPKSSSPSAVEIDTGKRIEHPDQSAYTAQASAYTSEVHGQDAKVEILGNPIMHPQELEAEVPAPFAQTEKRRSWASGDDSPGGTGTGTNVSSLSPVQEQQSPVEMESPRDTNRTSAYQVSPNTDTLPSMMERARGEEAGAEESNATYAVSDWSPSSPVERRGSKFQERL